MWNSPPATIVPGNTSTAAGTPIVISPPSGAAGLAVRAVVFNGSGCSLEIQGVSVAPWLNPTQQALYITNGIALTITPYGNVGGTVFVSWYSRDEEIPDQQGSGNLNTINIAGGTVTATISGNVDVVVQGTPNVEVSSGTINIGNTPSVEVTSGTIDIGNSPTVEIASGTVDVGTVSGGITIASGTITEIVDPVEVQDLPAVALTLTGSGPYVTSAVPAGYKALVIRMNSGGSYSGPSIVTVQGVTSGYGYAYQVACPCLTPLIVPIDPATDSTYYIRVASGAGVPYSVTAFAQPPVPPPAPSRISTGSVANPSGNSANYLSLITGDATHLYTLQKLDVHIVGNAASDNILLVGIEDLFGNSDPIKLGVYGVGSEENFHFDFGPGLPLANGSSVDVYCIGNGSGSGFGFVSMTATYTQQ